MALQPIPRLLIWLLSKCSNIEVSVQMESEQDHDAPTFYPAHPDVLMDDEECELAADYLEFCLSLGDPPID